jgi:hypothetical protein
VGIGKRAGADEQCACPTFGKACEARLDLVPVGRGGDDKLLPEGLCRFLYIGLFGCDLGCGRADEHGNGRRLRSKLTQQLQSLGP